ncbi:hypothetical protein HMPREF1985_01723 [Mitsuokella sp. oral taxon 131 str. W9106]|nr:hypothetical protein HMPREF1985_01723 [Mitsuokella sp. oral taxon 131 str. W9106]
MPIRSWSVIAQTATNPRITESSASLALADAFGALRCVRSQRPCSEPWETLLS